MLRRWMINSLLYKFIGWLRFSYLIMSRTLPQTCTKIHLSTYRNFVFIGRIHKCKGWLLVKTSETCLGNKFVTTRLPNFPTTSQGLRYLTIGKVHYRKCSILYFLSEGLTYLNGRLSGLMRPNDIIAIFSYADGFAFWCFAVAFFYTENRLYWLLNT